MSRKVIISIFAASAVWLSPAFAKNDHNQGNQGNQGNHGGQGYSGRVEKHDQGRAYGHPRYRAPTVYSRPQGYRPHSWVRGESLPTSYRRYRYRLDHSDYRLQQPPSDFRWIRVNNDALLTNMDTGRINQVVRNLFY